MTAETPDVSESELIALKTLWSHGPGTVRQIWKTVPESKWAYTTVQTLLQRLEKKGFVKSEKVDAARVYEATVSRDDLVQRRLGNLSRELCDGASLPLMLGLVQGEDFSKKDIQQFRDLLNELEKPARKPRKKK